MRVNNECIKAVLNFVIDNTSITCENTKCYIIQTDLYKVIENLEEKYDKATIVHSVIYASKCGYLDMKPIRETNNIMYSTCDIADVTPIGYKFLEEN